MKKRLFTLFCTLVLTFSLIPAAHADVLWTPDNQFFYNHSGECTYVGRSYYANGTHGYVTLWNAPDGGIVVDQFENGFTLQVYWQYEDWGCATIFGDEGWIDGWVPMAELALIYDYISFAEEHGAKIKDYNDEFADYSGDGIGIVFWDYPGAPAPKLVWDHNDIVPLLTGTEDGYSYISQTYVDEAGRTWGYVGYLYGSKNLWFCLDDPKGESLLPQEDTSEPSPDVSVQPSPALPPADPDTELVPPAAPKLPAAAYLPYILVGIVVLVTAALLFRFYRKKKKDRNSPPKS